jgi:hypothetical protein
MNRFFSSIRWSVLGLLIALVLFCGLLHVSASFGEMKPARERTVSWKRIADLPIRSMEGIDCDRDQDIFKSKTSENGLAINRFPLPSVSHVALHIEPIEAFDYQDFALFYWGADQPPEDGWTLANSHDILRGTPVDDGKGWIIVWHLPRPIVAGWFRLPAHASFRFRGLDVTAEPVIRADGTLDLAPMFVKGLGIVMVTSLILLLLQRWPKPWTLDAVLVKKVLILGLIPAYATMIFVFPPFQGPDEYLHWRHALERCRPDPFGEICLHNLYEISGANCLPFKTENQLPAQFLRGDPGDREPDKERETKVTYGTWFSHPFVWLVGVWFPRVETVREAFVFYYLCRTLPAIVLFVILWLANQRGLVPYTALVFLSFPLVMEQLTVVSSDTVVNLGTLLAALLFQSAWRRPSWQKTWVLWFLIAAVVLAKPPIYVGLCALPILVTPWRSMPRKRVWMPALSIVVVAAAIVGGYFAWQYGLRQMHGGGEGPSPSAKTIDFLLTRHGLHHFERLCRDTLIHRLHYWHGWYEPLGWLDTGLSGYHEALIDASFLLALGFDALYFAPAILGWIGRHYRLAAALWRGVPQDVTVKYMWDIVSSYFQLLMVIGLVLGGFLIVGILTCLIMYILYTEPGGKTLYGVQTRYFFPVGLLAMFLPLCLVDSPLDKQWPSARFAWLSSVIATFALSVLAWLWLARQIELTLDLLVRYW